MQSNPSTDFYDDNDYEDDEEDDKDEEYSEEADTPEKMPTAARQTASRFDETEEEVDLGYDEDDEPPKSLPPQGDQKDFMNEEGSGKRHKQQSRFRLDYLEKFKRKQQKSYNDEDDDDNLDDDDDDDDADEPRREGSGNFANDDDDNEDDDDDDGDNSNDNFFSSKRKSNSRYFRKNTNDAIKIISTPLGKVGIVYQQTPPEQSKSDDSSSSSKTQFTDFDALSPADPNTHRRASLHPKITPVLTADGRVALLYRGDSENTKYEPILNLTHKFNLYDNKTSAATIAPSSESDDDDDDDNSNEDDDRSNHDSGGAGEIDAGLDNDNDNEENSSDENSVTEQAAPTPPPPPAVLAIDRSNSVLPMINRPLSEVLGIKKNQFRQFRVKDSPTTTSTESPFGLHFLTKKVNLANYQSKSRNHDFDFSQDTTMLDERKRIHNQPQYPVASETQSDNNNAPDHTDASSIATQDILSKTEVVNLAIIPHFDEEFERQQRFRDHEIRRHHRQRHRHKHTQQDLSSIHCIMQATMGIAAISTVFGMLGTFFKQRVLDQIRLMHW